MLTPEEYQAITPYRDKILLFSRGESVTIKEQPLVLINNILQAHKMGSICFSCTGSKFNAVNEMAKLILQYEESI